MAGGASSPSRPSLLSTAAIICAMMILLGFSWDGPWRPLRSLLIDLAAPLHSAAALPAALARSAAAGIASREQLRRENRRLRQEILVLKGRTATITALAAENARLHRLLNAARLVETRVLVAEIVAELGGTAAHRVLIDKGRAQGAHLGQAVINGDGLVGQIVHLGAGNSEVLLISDAASAVPVEVERNGLRAIVSGTGNRGHMRMENITGTMDLQLGDRLVTSGLGGRFPRNYPVGRVSHLSGREGDVLMEVEVSPAARLHSSRHLLLLFASARPLQ